MAKITISDLTAAFASATALNAKFQQIEDALNNLVLYRDNTGTPGEPNGMASTLDMDGQKIINLPVPTTDFEPVTWGQAKDIPVQVSTAASSAAAAEVSRIAAELAETNTAASYDSFDDRYLGAKAADPITDNDGNTLLTGAIYYNTAVNQMKVWSGATWDLMYEGFDDLYLGAKASAPSTDNDLQPLTAGQIYFNTTTPALWFYTGSAWQLYNSSAATSANTVAVADAGGYFAGTDLEVVTQEIGAALGGLKTKVIDIGGWDMDTNAQKVVSHGLNYLLIRGISVLVRDDANTELYDFNYWLAGQTNQNSIKCDATSVTLNRADGGYFDNIFYSLIGSSRGWITIQYV